MTDPELAAARLTRAIRACSEATVIATYASRSDEPDTMALIEALSERGARVLLPVLTTEADWAWYESPDQLSPGPRGIPQPRGVRLGAQALALADWIWLPGLAGTPNGDRLGTGGGWYDRALAHSRPGTPRAMLLNDSEILADLPVDVWDEPVDLLVTELRRLDCRPE